MNKDLIKKLMNPGPSASVVHALDPNTEDPIGRVAAQPVRSGDCAGEIQAGIDAMGVPELSAGVRKGLSHIDQRAEARVAVGYAVQLRTAPEVEQATGITAADLREVCAKKRVTDAIVLGGRLLRRAATDTHIVTAGLILYIDRSVQQVVVQDLTGGALSDDEKQDLIYDLTPRLALFITGDEEKGERHVRLKRALHDASAQADEAEDALAAYRVFDAVDRGEVVSPEDVAAALAWRAREDEAERERLRHAAAAADADDDEDADPSRRSTKAGKAGTKTRRRMVR
jgi:hypothetical protein